MIQKSQLVQLVEAAIEARKGAYAPYSQFAVGAALLAQDGQIFTGCNVENSSYGLSVCAERIALFKAVSEGVHEFSAIAIVADTKDPVSPCGACRQVLAEFSPNLMVIMANLEKEQHLKSLSELLPYPFSDSDLPSDH